MDIGTLGAIIFLATFVEGFVEFLFAAQDRLKPYLHYFALIVGVALAIAYNIDIPGMFGLAVNYGIVSNIVSGVIIGRGSNYVNDVVSMMKGRSSDG